MSFRRRDNLPGVCIVCGAPATGQCSLQVDLPPEADATAMTLLQFVGLVFGFLFLWWRTTPIWWRGTPDAPDNEWLQLPRCDEHGSADHIRSVVTLAAIDRYTIEIDGASAEFRQALELLQTPPSPDMLAALDAGPDRDADAFLKDIEKSTVRTPNDYLQDLERETHNG